MSNRGAERSADASLPGMGSLEKAIDLAIVEVRSARERAGEAEKRAERSAAMLRQFVAGDEDAGALSRRVAALEAENEDLRGRIERGRRAIDRVLAGLRFLENRR